VPDEHGTLTLKVLDRPCDKLVVRLHLKIGSREWMLGTSHEMRVEVLDHFIRPGARAMAKGMGVGFREMTVRAYTDASGRVRWRQTDVPYKATPHSGSQP